MTVHYLATICLGLYLAAAILFLLQVIRGEETTIRPRLLLFLGLLTHSALIVPFVISSKSIIPESRSEYLFWLSWALVVIYFIGGKRVNFPVFGAFVAPLSAFFLTGSSYLAHFLMLERNGSDSSLFLYVHVAPAMLAELCLVVAFILSCVFIMQESRLKRGKSAYLALQGPSLEILEKLNQKALVLGFISMTFAVLSGTLWALSERASILGTDIYQWVAILAWILLGFMLHVRLNLHWSARKLSRITVFVAGTVIASFAIMIVLFGNTIHVGYHFE